MDHAVPAVEMARKRSEAADGGLLLGGGRRPERLSGGPDDVTKEAIPGLDKVVGHLQAGVDHLLPPNGPSPRPLPVSRQRLVDGDYELPNRANGCLLSCLD